MIVSINNLEKIRKENIGKRIILCLGSFDLLHFEHVSYLNDAKKLGDILVVAVKDDTSVSLKGAGRPIVDENHRLFMVDNLKCVDYTILANSYCDIEKINKKFLLEDNIFVKDWWKIFYNIFKELRPDVLYYENSELYQLSRNKISKLFDISLIERERTEKTSTTKIINKIRSNK